MSEPENFYGDKFDRPQDKKKKSNKGLGLLLPLVAAVPIVAAIVSQRGGDSGELPARPEATAAQNPAWAAINGFADVDGNGVPDGLEDRDGNGVLDGLEDRDTDGQPDGFPDLNSDGLPDGFADENGDGIADALVDLNANGVADGFEDRDKDGNADGLVDSDKDGAWDGLAKNELPEIGVNLTEVAGLPAEEAVIKEAQIAKKAAEEAIAEVAKVDANVVVEEPKTQSRISRPKLTPVSGLNPDGTYTVQSKDTLYSIGQRFGYTAEDIASTNGFGVNAVIREGQVLALPGRATIQGGYAPTQVGSVIRPVSGLPAQEVPGPRYENGQTTAVPMDTSVPNDYPLAGGSVIQQSAPSSVVVPTRVGPPLNSYPAPKTQEVLSNYCIVYTVRSHDSVQSIAEAFSTTSDRIRGHNQIQQVTTGQMIMVPVDHILTNCR